jgi:hypothetical protein
MAEDGSVNVIVKTKLDEDSLEKTAKRIQDKAGSVEVRASKLGGALQQAGGLLGGGGGAALGGAGGVLKSLSDPLTAIFTGIQAIKDIAQFGIDLFKKAFDLLLESSPLLKAMFQIVYQGFMFVIRPFADMMGTLMRPFVLQFLKWSVGFYHDMAKALKDGTDLGHLSDDLSNEIGTLVLGIANAIEPVFTKMIDVFTPAIQQALPVMISAVMPIITAAVEKWTPAIMGAVVKGITDFMASPQMLTQGILGPSILSWKGLLGGSHFATGGIAYTPQTATVGENGPERITPLGQSGGGGSMVIQFNAPVYGMNDFETKVKQIFARQAVSIRRSSG